jgi:hypothetical protein
MCSFGEHCRNSLSRCWNTLFQECEPGPVLAHTIATMKSMHMIATMNFDTIVTRSLHKVHGEKALCTGHVDPSVCPLVSTREIMNGEE